MNSQFGTSSNARKKRVYYSGTSTIREGMPLSYNYDTLNNILGYDKGAGGDAACQTTPTTTGEGNQNEGKFMEVEDVSVTNKSFFAGVVAGSSYDGVVGPKWLDIYIANDAIVPVRTDKSITALDKLYLEAGESTVVNDSTSMPCVAVAEETVDRSTVAGIVLAKMSPVRAVDIIETVTAASRTTVQLPTAAIWNNFNLSELRANPFAGVLYEADFRRASDMPGNIFTDTDSNVSLNAEAVGAMQMLGSVDNEAVEIQIPGAITVSGGKPWAFEARLKCNTVTANDIGFFLGLLTGQELTGALIADNGAAMIDSNHVGFQSFHADTTGIDAVYTAVGETAIIHDADVKTMTINTYFTVGMYFDGTDIRVYVDGVDTADPILASDIAAGGDDFPAATVLVPTLATKNGAAEDDVVIYDWVRFAQEG